MFYNTCFGPTYIYNYLYICKQTAIFAVKYIKIT